ncbi:MAG: GNAT family N-acetyltransferase [Alistipes sp.]|nr:GNAT family N-acetyltransferase [Alistipes sp.]
MIEFHPVRLADRAAIERYTMPSGIRNCDLAFANMFCWQAVYRSAWAVVEGFLVVRFQIGGGPKIGYMQPVGEGDFTRIVPALADDAHAHGQRLRLIGLTDEGRDQLRRACPGVFAFHSDRASEDYLYRADDLRTLPGRRYQPKRNHINRFTAACPDFRYEELTPERFAECMTLERQWRRVHEGHTSELCAEQRAMQLAFDHFDELGLRGGCLYVGERLAAFTYGSAVSERTFVTHVEKADTAFEGAFAVINKLFAEHLPPQFELINREEDLGIEGLRHAKLSYHPAELLHKYAAIRLHPDEAACKELWMKVFGDGNEFIDTFLMRCYRRDRMLTAQCKGRTAAMLHILPFDTELGRSSYIYGVATDPEFRNRGLASQLMEQALRQCDERGDEAVFLIPTPDKEWLRGFYGRFGFSGAVPAEFRSPDGFDFGTGDPATDLAMVRLRQPGTPLPERLTCRYRPDQL